VPSGSSDIDFFGLVPAEEPGRFAFEVTEPLARLDGYLYGGTAIAVSIATSQLLTERSPLWMTTQFVSTVDIGTEMGVEVEVLADGRRTKQVRVTGTAPSGDVVFASLGATGTHRPDGLTGAFETCPTVAPPDEAVRWDSPLTGLMRMAGMDTSDLDDRLGDAATMARRGFATVIDMREPEILEHPEPGPGRLCLWVHRRDGGVVTPALVAYLADFVPMGVAHALGVVAGGTSLDNTIRFGPFVESEWMLLDLRPHLAVGGYGHGIAHVWSDDGHLVATASQTASMVQFDLGRLAELTGADEPP
jgi:acyl-CoA thioesterase